MNYSTEIVTWILKCTFIAYHRVPPLHSPASLGILRWENASDQKLEVGELRFPALGELHFAASYYTLTTVCIVHHSCMLIIKTTSDSSSTKHHQESSKKVLYRIFCCSGGQTFGVRRRNSFEPDAL